MKYYCFFTFKFRKCKFYQPEKERKYVNNTCTQDRMIHIEYKTAVYKLNELDRNITCLKSSSIHCV